MKKIFPVLFSALLIQVFTTVNAQYPAALIAPKGVFVLIDSAWHKNSVIEISRSDNSGSFTDLVKITVPLVESEFKKGIRNAEKDFTALPESDEKSVSAWWMGLNASPAMPVFMMNPAGLIAAGIAYYDKSAIAGATYNYRILITDATGKAIQEKLTGNTLHTSVQSLPVPRFIRATEDEKIIRVCWGYVPKKMPAFVKVYRLMEGEKDYGEMKFSGGFNVKGDSVFITHSDTLVKAMSAYKYIIRAFDWLGNAYPVSDTAIARAYSVYSAPVIRMFYTKAVPEKHAIRLSWPQPEGQSLRGILLFRSSGIDGSYIHLATLPATDTSYTDIVPLANENYWYFAVVANRFGYGMPSARVFDLVSTSTIPLPPSAPKISASKKGAEISWSGKGGVIIGYYVYRGEGYRGQLKQLSDIVKPSASPLYLDSTALPGSAYRYAVAALGEGNGISKLSDSVSVMLPANGNITVPFNLSYRIEGSGIMLFWENLLNDDGMVRGYMVYRKAGGKTDFSRLTQSALSSLTNSFTDSTIMGGQTVEYAIASVDPKGIESRRSIPLLIEIPEPARIQVGDLSLINDGGNVIVKWSEIIEPAVTAFKVFRFTETSEPVLIGTAKPGENCITDRSPARGNVLNNYFVKAVYGESIETEPAEISAIRVP
ncbi:MAG: fibronectin type III domain-containing protein [Bacteroidota bacterium]